jgi:hypothetical protein
MNLHSIKKRLAVIEAKLPTLGAGKLFRVGKGMLGLRMAIQQAREAAQSALPSAPLVGYAGQAINAHGAVARRHSG